MDAARKIRKARRRPQWPASQPLGYWYTASKKSSAVPKRPPAATLAPRDSRYFGRNFFHSTSPSPTRNTAPEAAATLRSIPKKSVMRSAMLASGFLFLASVRSVYVPSTKSPVWLPALHHFLAVRIQRIVNNPLGRIDFMVVLKIQVEIGRAHV